MKQLFEAALAAWGQKVLLDEREVKAFVQPMAKNSAYAPLDITELGAKSTRLWRVIAAVNCGILENSVIKIGNVKLEAVHFESVYLGSEPQYITVIAREIIGE